MQSIDMAVSKSMNKTVDINKVCTIRKYISIKEKFRILKEFENLYKNHVNDYPGFESFIAYVFFNLKMIKEYTDIEVEFTYECFD